MISSLPKVGDKVYYLKLVPKAPEGKFEVVEGIVEVIDEHYVRFTNGEDFVPNILPVILHKTREEAQEAADRINNMEDE